MTTRILINQPNKVIFTLNEKKTLSDPNYLMEIFSKQTHDSKIIRLSGDTSINPTRFNEFIIEESQTEDLNAAIVTLIPGEYNYFIYETTGLTLSISAATSILESGLVKVVGTGQTTHTFSDTPSEFTITY